MIKIFYCIPLKGKAVSSDWGKDVKSLENLIDSLLFQANTTLTPHIVISGHDKPASLNTEKYSNYITFVPNNDLQIPRTIEDKNRDKQAKKRSGLAKIFELSREGDFLAISDADDIMHCDLFNEIEKKFSKDITDLVFFTGYMYNSVSKDLAYIDGINSIFYKVCGSCIVSKITKQDISDKFKFFYRLDNHTKFYDICLSNNRKPYKFTFPAALYMHNSILNLSSGNIYIKKMFEDFKADKDYDFAQLNKYFAFKKIVSFQQSLIGKIQKIGKALN